MPVKDYYKMLNLQPGATQQEIKRAYRRLALRYHPDTNRGSQYSEAWFRELQEAYKTLTQPELREAYHQERWLQQSLGRPLQTAAPLTPETIRAEAQQLAHQVEHLDHFRMDHKALQQSLLQLLSPEKLEALLHYHLQEVNRNITRQVIAATIPLDYPYQQAVFAQLQKLCVSDPPYANLVMHTAARRRRNFWWDKNQWWLILLVTVVLCGILFWIA
jgi:hypothetical protein